MLHEQLLQIPEPVSITGWKEVPIEECGEPLIKLNYLDPRIEVGAEYFRQRINGASSIQYLRQGPAERLIIASSMLPSGFKLVVFDAYRPLSVQTALFNGQLQNLQERYTNLTEDQLIAEAQRYVSIPSADPTKPSPHTTGGAIDLSVVDSGRLLLDMGTEFDFFGPQTQTGYFKGILNAEDIHSNRRLLYTVMSEAGFTNYFEEWWHFDFGNQFWGKVKGRSAIYGLADLETLNGRIPEDPISSQSETTIYSVRSDGSVETYSPRFGLAGNPDQLTATLQDLSKLHHPNFAIKRQLAEIIIGKHNVHRFAI